MFLKKMYELFLTMQNMKTQYNVMEFGNSQDHVFISQWGLLPALCKFS